MMLLTAFAVKCLAHFAKMFVCHMRVDLGRGNVGVDTAVFGL